MQPKSAIQSARKSHIREHNPILNTITFIVMLIGVFCISKGNTQFTKQNPNISGLR